MLNIGCHLSTTKGYENMGKEAIKIGANTFQYFTRNPRGGKAKDIDEKDILALRKLMEKNKFAKILAHAPYTLNGCSADESTRQFATEMMADDLERLKYLPTSLYNFHPGSHVKQGVDVGINYIVEMLNKVLKPEHTTIVLLETMAGKGTEVGRTFEEIAEIIKDEFPDTNFTDLIAMVDNYKSYDSWLKTPKISEEIMINLENIMIDNNELEETINFNELVYEFN